jgi:hypothetical protein
MWQRRFGEALEAAAKITKMMHETGRPAVEKTVAGVKG